MHAKKTSESFLLPSQARELRLPDVPLAEVRFRLSQALGQEGFATLAEIDVADFLNRSVDVDHAETFVYEIAHAKLLADALGVASDASLVVPFKIALWQEGKDVVLAALPTGRLATALGRSHLETITADLDDRLAEVFERMSGPAPASYQVPMPRPAPAPQFSPDELEVLREATQRQIQSLMTEVAGTESHALQHALAKTITQLEAIASKLGSPGRPTLVA